MAKELKTKTSSSASDEKKKALENAMAQIEKM